MRIKFKNGVEKNCTNLTEQKLFKSGSPAGWLCSFCISEPIASAELDEILTEDNISKLAFSKDGSSEQFAVNGYTKVSSVVIRYNDSGSTVEIQLSKGL